MSYRGDFYIPQNIIGYTGNINNNPTVYFQNGTSYGHITQAHDIRQNVGREEVCQAQDYQIINVNGRAEEWAGGRCIHPSRNAFISVAGLGSVAKCILSLAISNHKEMKQWGELTERQQDLVFDGKLK
jgi:hypothetical protein